MIVRDETGMNIERQQIAAGIDHDVALAALDLLVGIVSGNGRVFRCFHALTVDHACCGAAIATDRCRRSESLESESPFVFRV